MISVKILSCWYLDNFGEKGDCCTCTGTGTGWLHEITNMMFTGLIILEVFLLIMLSVTERYLIYHVYRLCEFYLRYLSFQSFLGLLAV